MVLTAINTAGCLRLLLDACTVCGRRVGNTYLEHRFSAFSALLAHGRFGEVRTSPSYTAALAQQYLRYRAGLHLLHREVETAVRRM